jgi:predicted GNAT superfamily acetyltransferase
MLAVLEPRRAKGVGYALKLAQRAQAIDAGVRLVRWTFDPLIARNAHFNLGKLGVVADRFERNYYGEMTDALNRGDRSDRLVARWEVDREPAPRAVPRLPERPLVTAVGPPDAPRPEPTAERPDAEHAWSVAVPWDHAALRGSEPELARAWRDAVGDALESAISAGLVAGAFVSDRGERTARYVLASAEAVDAVRGETG